MTVAIISTKPPEILKTTESTTFDFNVPGFQAYGIQSGFVSLDGAYKAVDVIPFVLPDGKQIIGEPAYSFNESGDVVQSYQVQDIPPPPPPPEPVPPPEAVISMRQCRLALLAFGILDQVDAAIKASANRAMEIEWDYASEVRRGSPIIAAMAPQLGLTDEQIDGLFAQAATL